MMTNKKFIAFLKNKVKESDFKFYNSFCDYSAPKSIAVYNRSNAQQLHTTDMSLLPITLMVTYGTNADAAQVAAYDIYNSLRNIGRQTIDDVNFIIDIKNTPACLGKNEAGNFAYAIDINIFYEGR